MDEPEDRAQMGGLTVGLRDSGSSLLDFVGLYLVNESKTTLRRLIASGQVRLNGSAAVPQQPVAAGDRISLPPGLSLAGPPPQTVPIHVLYEDEDLLCINKAPGMTVLPGRWQASAAFHRSLVAFLNREAPPAGPFVRPHLVHRLDRDTSGVLLVAKTAQAGRALSEQFQAHQVAKTYVAVTEGVLPRAELTADVPLARAPGEALLMAPDARRGKAARTELAVKERFGHFCVLEARPLTGRQHQIRAHLAAIGYPLAVDPLYGRRAELTGAGLNAILGWQAAPPGQAVLARVPLHAAAISYVHPGTGLRLRHEAPLPDDLCGFVDLLRQVDGAR